MKMKSILELALQLKFLKDNNYYLIKYTIIKTIVNFNNSKLLF